MSYKRNIQIPKIVLVVGRICSSLNKWLRNLKTIPSSLANHMTNFGIDIVLSKYIKKSDHTVFLWIHGI